MAVVDQQRLRRYRECRAGQLSFPLYRDGPQNSWQRSAMTVNHDISAIDTSSSQPTQALSQFNDPSSVYSDYSVKGNRCLQATERQYFRRGTDLLRLFHLCEGNDASGLPDARGRGFDPNNMVKAIRMDMGTVPFKPKGGDDPVGHYWLEAPRRARGRSLWNETHLRILARAGSTQTRSDRPAIASGFVSMRLRLRSMTGANQREAVAACAGRAAREAAAPPPPQRRRPCTPPASRSPGREGMRSGKAQSRTRPPRANPGVPHHDR